MSKFANYALLRCAPPRAARSVPTLDVISTPVIFLEVVGSLTSECVDTIHQLLESGPRLSNSKPIAISFLRSSGTQWDAALQLVECCKSYMRDGRHVLLLGDLSTQAVFNSIEPTLTWVDGLARLTIARHIIVANRLRTQNREGIMRG